MAHKSQLERELGRARITDFKEASKDQVGVGSVVQVSGPSGAIADYTILGAWDGDPDNRIISYKTPLGAALLGRKIGDSVKLKIGGAEEAYTVVGISRYVDAAPAAAAR
jgi:transcription elongation GreA/GreB family factor